jgi:hypothetical protein
MAVGLKRLAQRHPALFSGAWFAAAALLLASPLGAMTLLLLGVELWAGRPVGGYARMMWSSIAMPLIPAFGMGALVGPRILRLPPGRYAPAAGWGAAAGLGSLLLWVGLLEVVSWLLAGRVPAAGDGGDVPGAAVVVGYVVVLPLIVMGCALVGAAAGVLLQGVRAHGPATERP